MWPHERAASMFYGNPSGGNGAANPAWESANIIDLIPPYAMRYSWGPAVTRLRFHRKCRDAFGEAFLEIKKLYGTQENIEAHRLHLTGGSFMFRLMRGSATRLSIHAYGAAVDIDPQLNPFPRQWRPWPHGTPREAAACFEKVGLIWRGANHDVDGMHYQAAIHD